MILLIDHYDSFTYNLAQLISGKQPVCVRRSDQITVAEIEAMGISAIVLSPGPGRPEDAGIFLEVIRAFAGKLPILGVCLGHQAIAAAFGGRVIRSSEIVHGKSCEIFHNREDLFEKLSLPFTAGRYHSLIVERESLPECLEVVAESGDGTVMAIRHKEYPLFGVQFHPESVLTPEGGVLIAAFLNQEALCSKNS